MISQLRIYTINRGKLDAFVEGWKKFRISAALPVLVSPSLRPGQSENGTSFVWIVVPMTDPKTGTPSKRLTTVSPERAAVDP